MRLPHERFTFSAMPERARIKLPDNARMAVYVNLLVWRQYQIFPTGPGMNMVCEWVFGALWRPWKNVR